MLTGLEQVGLVVNLGDVPGEASGSTKYPILIPQNRDIKVTGAKVATIHNIYADDTTYAEFSLMKATPNSIASGSGLGTGTCVAYLKTRDAGLSAAGLCNAGLCESTFAALVVDSDEDEIDEDDQLYLQVDQAGVGLSGDHLGLCSLTFQLEYEITE